ncbi:chromate transporter [Niallia sp. Krafla_26]|uniref:chromate transporter n=1 Tax=Niallia sp. Krafla_26 TaxID=3064703 RepID=UPI003D16D2D6
MKLYVDIFIAFFRSGMLGFGGGPSSIPLVHKEVVKTYKWMDDEQFSNVLALGNTLPGPINTKMAGYIGYRVGGISGLFVALIALILPTVILMLFLLSSFNQFKDHQSVQGMTHAIVPIVGVMMGLLTWGFLKKAKSWLGWTNCNLLLVASFITIVILQIHPGVVIGILLIGAMVLPIKDNSRSEGL